MTAPTFTPRQLALGGALAVTLAATAWVATRPDDTVVATAAPARRPAPAAPMTTTAALPATTASAPANIDDRPLWVDASPAQLVAWQPPPPPPPPPAPPPVQPAPPPPPVAPPAPYQMIGRVIEGEGAKAVEVALLSGPNKALSVKRGDVIDGQWRVEQVSTAGVRLTWLPSQLPQNIVFKTIP